MSVVETVRRKYELPPSQPTVLLSTIGASWSTLNEGFKLSVIWQEPQFSGAADRAAEALRAALPGAAVTRSPRRTVFATKTCEWQRASALSRTGPPLPCAPFHSLSLSLSLCICEDDVTVNKGSVDWVVPHGFNDEDVAAFGKVVDAVCQSFYVKKRPSRPRPSGGVSPARVARLVCVFVCVRLSVRVTDQVCLTVRGSSCICVRTCLWGVCTWL